MISGNALTTLRIIEGRVLRTKTNGSGGGEVVTGDVFYTADGEIFHTVDDAVLRVKGGA